MSIRQVLAWLWSDLSTPSKADDSPYDVLIQAVGHAMLGATIGLFFALAVASWRLLLPVGYWLVKERADLRKGGGVVDGLVDTGFVLFGTFYGPAWWPVAVLVAALVTAIASTLLRADRPVNAPLR